MRIADPLPHSVNKVWDPIEKCFFLLIDLLIDLGLNICFIHLVKNRLIANGLTKYNRLLYVNISMVAINISLDVRPANPREKVSPNNLQVAFIGLMWFPNTSVFVQSGVHRAIEHNSC